MPFEWKLEGHIWSDNAVGAHKLSLFVRLKTLLVGGIFLDTLFFAVEKKSIWLEMIQVKNHQEDGAQRAFSY